ncbi:hypothetical protein GCM10009834_37940 [Streptomonospora arabica]
MEFIRYRRSPTRDTDHGKTRNTVNGPVSGTTVQAGTIGQIQLHRHCNCDSQKKRRAGASNPPEASSQTDHHEHAVSGKVSDPREDRA